VVGSFDGVSPHSGSFQATSGGGTIISQTLATMAGQSYTVDFWVAASSLQFGVPFNVFWGGSQVFTHDLAAGNTPYTEFTFNVTASSASTNLAFSFGGGGGNMFLDDVSVTPAGVPDGGSTVSLLGCALLGLVALRRKLSC
jgi:flagellin